jgi:hypothetical protein
MCAASASSSAATSWLRRGWQVESEDVELAVLTDSWYALLGDH